MNMEFIILNMKKLQYLLSFIGYENYYLEDFYNSYCFQNVRDAVCEYAGDKLE